MRTGVRTDDYESLKQAARDDDRSVSALMRRVVREYLDWRGDRVGRWPTSGVPWLGRQL